MKDYKTEGIIIRARDYGEADRIITLFTREHGKVQAIVKGCRKPKSQKRGVTQLFTYGDFVIYSGRSLDTVTQCQAKETFGPIRQDLDRMAYATYLVELLDGFVNSGDPHEDLFFLSLICLHLLTADEPELVIRAFEIRLMGVLGYRPQLADCVVCGTELSGSKIFFSPRLGGGLCDRCISHDTEFFSCKLGTINMLKQLAVWDLKRLRILKLSGETKREIGQIMKRYIDHRLEKKIKSADFLQSLTSVHN